jgi:hypothetical protein
MTRVSHSRRIIFSNITVRPSNLVINRFIQNKLHGVAYHKIVIISI